MILMSCGGGGGGGERYITILITTTVLPSSLKKYIFFRELVSTGDYLGELGRKHIFFFGGCLCVGGGGVNMNQIL